MIINSSQKVSSAEQDFPEEAEVTEPPSPEEEAEEDEARLPIDYVEEAAEAEEEEDQAL